MRPLGEPISFTLDSITFEPADANEVTLFFNTYGHLYHIRKFTLKDKVVKLDTAEQILPYVIAIKNLPFLEEVSFSGASLGIWAAYSLADALRTRTRLCRADFSNCFTGRKTPEMAPAVDALVSAFLELPALESISLADNAFGPDVEWPIVRLVRAHTPLRELDINNVGLGPKVGAVLATALVNLAQNKAAAGAPPLRALLSNRNRLVQDDDAPLPGMAEWAAAFAAHPQLRTVDLGNNGIRREGMDRLVRDGLAHLHAIEELDLQDNTIASRGGTHTALAEAAGGWPNLRALNLNDSLLGSRGAALLVPALAAVQPSRLESLKMAGNNLNKANTAALAGAFAQLSELREVELNLNNIPEDDEGFWALKRMLEGRGRERGIEARIDSLEDFDQTEPSQ
ncbi:putative ran gtpase-activating protein 1 [Diaporthe ampelina]|uniref:Putative ran gtpase-activating protein 1 n=1 Tax=Diaporthe ampelina TaxID=1214573 RepID=A0A0G2I1X0_9PEZI|nr:putative ran gtpase-activating protein 1 [Diaporthe ampelina]